MSGHKTAGPSFEPLKPAASQGKRRTGFSLAIVICATMGLFGWSAVEAPSEGSPEESSPEPTATKTSASRTQSILEQRRAMMRGDALGRTKVEIKKSTPAAIAKGDITFDDLQFDIVKNGVFKRDKLNNVIKSLHGRKVTLRGYILPTTLFKESDIDRFVLVRDNLECCFGPGAALFDCVMVEMVPGATTDFVPRPVTVRGVFEIDEEKYRYPGGRGPEGASHLAIFRILGEEVR